MLLVHFLPSEFILESGVSASESSLCAAGAGGARAGRPAAAPVDPHTRSLQNCSHSYLPPLVPCVTYPCSLCRYSLLPLTCSCNKLPYLMYKHSSDWLWVITAYLRPQSSDFLVLAINIKPPACCMFVYVKAVGSIFNDFILSLLSLKLFKHNK